MSEGAPTDVPHWRLAGDWFDVCSCDIACPCEFAQPPTDNVCEGVISYRIREGNYGDVPLDGLCVVILTFFEGGNLWTGDVTPKAGFYVDERADERQREAIDMIFSGRAGGWPAVMQAIVGGGERQGLAYVPIEFEVADDLAGWRVEIPGRVSAAAEALTGPTARPGERVQLHNPPGSEVGPGHVATWGSATAYEVDGSEFGMKRELPGKSSKHIPFEWSGPA